MYSASLPTFYRRLDKYNVIRFGSRVTLNQTLRDSQNNNRVTCNQHLSVFNAVSSRWLRADFFKAHAASNVASSLCDIALRQALKVDTIQRYVVIYLGKPRTHTVMVTTLARLTSGDSSVSCSHSKHME